MIENDNSTHSTIQVDSETVQKIQSLLQDNEALFSALHCFKESNEIVFVLTNKRLLILDEKLLSIETISLPFSEIATVVYDARLVTTEIIIVAKPICLKVSKVDKQLAVQCLEYLGERIGDDFITSDFSERVLAHKGEKIDTSEIPSQNEVL